MNPRSKLIATAALFLPLALAARPDDPVDIRARIQGTWQMKKAEVKGQTLPEAFIRDQFLAFEKDTYKSLQKDEVDESGTYTIDMTKTPYTIDLKIEKGKEQGKTQLGILAFDGENLKLAFNHPGDTKRPEKFEAAADSNTFVVLLERKAAAP